MNPTRPSQLALVALIAGLLLGGCGFMDEAFTPRAQVLGQMDCKTGEARALDPALGLVGCSDGAWRLNGSTWEQTLDVGALAAAAPRDDRKALLVATEDGRIARFEGQGKPTFITLPKLKIPKGGPLYSFRPVGHKDAKDADVTALRVVDSNDVVAISAGLGAWRTDDDGQSWKPLIWNARFSHLSGSRPLQIDDLTFSQTARIAFILYPEGLEIAQESLEKHIAAGEGETVEATGPVVVTATLTDQRTTVRAMPVGRAHNLVHAPVEKAHLWLFVTHGQRDEATRFQSNDWGRMYLDTGYYDFRILEAFGTERHVAMIGLDDNDRSIVYIKGSGATARYGFVDLPGDEGPLGVQLDDQTHPTNLIITRGPTAIVYDLTDIDGDSRLGWYAVPALTLGPLALFILVRRFAHERTLRKQYEAAAAPTDTPPEPETAAEQVAEAVAAKATAAKASSAEPDPGDSAGG